MRKFRMVVYELGTDSPITPITPKGLSKSISGLGVGTKGGKYRSLAVGTSGGCGHKVYSDSPIIIKVGVNHVRTDKDCTIEDVKELDGIIIDDIWYARFYDWF